MPTAVAADNPYRQVAARAKRDFDYCCGALLKIKPKDAPLCPLHLNWPQRYIWQRYLQPAWDAREPLALLILKARREGVSTLVRAWHFHHATFFRGQQCYLTAHDDDTSQELFRMDRTFYQNLPKRLQPPLIANNRMELEYGAEWAGSSMRVRVAKFEDIGHGKTIQHWHACLRGDVEVVRYDGTTCPIRHVEAGAMVRTHTGALAAVKHCVKTPSQSLPTAGTPLVVIQSVLSLPPITCTGDHRIWTRQGWKAAQAILPGDFLGLLRRRFFSTRPADFVEARLCSVEGDSVWVPVQRVGAAPEEECVYDLDIAHPDHSYECVGGFVHNSEVGYYPIDSMTGAPAALPGLLEAVPTTGRSSIVWETTAVQADTWFHQVWLEAERNKHRLVGYGNRRWQTVFLPWFYHPDHQAEWLEEYEPLGKEEVEIQRRFKLSMPQMAWRRGKIEELNIEYPGQGLRRYHQQYPSTSEEPFLLAGTCVFPEQALAEMLRQERPPSLGFQIVRTGQWRCNLVEEKHLDTASFLVWEPPRQGCEYTLGVDVSRGVGRDDSAVVVMRMPGYQTVAHWADNFVAPKQLAYMVAAIARYYAVRSGTHPICTVEINDAGILVNSELETMRAYEPLDIFVWEYWDTVGQQQSTKTGWMTTHRSKDLLLGLANSLMLARQTFQPSRWIRADMGRTIEIRPGVARTGGCDLVIAWLLALMTAYRKIARFHDPEGLLDLARGQGAVFGKSFASDDAMDNLHEQYGDDYVYKDRVFYDSEGDKIRRGVGGKSIMGVGALW